MKHVHDNNLKITGSSDEVDIAKFYYSYFIYMKDVEIAQSVPDIFFKHSAKNVIFYFILENFLVWCFTIYDKMIYLGI